MSEEIPGSEKSLILILLILCTTAIVLVGSFLAHYHFAPEAVRIEEIKNERMQMIFDELQFKDETKLKLYLAHIREIANAAGADLTENEVKEVQEEFTEEHDFETERGPAEGR